MVAWISVGKRIGLFDRVVSWVLSLILTSCLYSALGVYQAEAPGNLPMN